MLTYENLVAILFGCAERTGLNIAYTQELLDTHALGRSLSITCLPDGFEDDRSPTEPPLRAVIVFRWSPEFTVFSLRGSDTLDSIERLVDERLSQSQSGISLDVEVIYTLPLTSDQHDLEALPLLVDSLHTMNAELAFSDVPFRVESQLLFLPNRPPRVQELTAHRVWSLDEALYDSDLLNDTFDQLCLELKTMLEALVKFFPLAHTSDRNAKATELADRRYLKPPTA